MRLLYLVFLVFVLFHQLINGKALQGPDLEVDPRLIGEAIEVWDVIASENNPVWPGWNAKDTPLLFYLPKVQDLLINHPNPPEGFVPYEGDIVFPGSVIYVRTGKTFLELDGQNTSRKINGKDTLVVADTLSNLRTQLMGMMGDPQSLAQDYSLLKADPYDQMAMIAHEAFHVFQAQRAPDKYADEGALRTYPVLSVANNVGFALEGEALREALLADTEMKLREAAVKWLALRFERRYNLSQSSIDYEDGNEFMEGLAKYVEFKLASVMIGRKAQDSMKWVQGYHGNKGFADFKKQLVDQMVQHMGGRINVNNDPYGTAPLRMRFYYSGMAIAGILDRLAPEWKSKIFEKNTTLTDLADKALNATPEMLQQKLDEVKTGSAYSELVREKEELEAKGLEHQQALLDSILQGEKTLLTIDYSALKCQVAGMGYTPFGICALDEHRTIYTMVPIQGIVIRGYEFKQDTPRPLLHNTKDALFQQQLSEKLTLEELKSLIGTKEIIRKCELELPGIFLRAKKARVELKNNQLYVFMLPARR